MYRGAYRCCIELIIRSFGCISIAFASVFAALRVKVLCWVEFRDEEATMRPAAFGTHSIEIRRSYSRTPVLNPDDRFTQ